MNQSQSQNGLQNYHGALIKPEMIRAIEARLRHEPMTILIRGERGTGKDLMARVIHRASAGAGAPFVKVDCAVLSPDRLRSLLFGAEKDTRGAGSRRLLGAFELASRGTLFLDSVDSLPRELLPVVREALERGMVTRMGGHRPVPVAARVISATSCVGPASDRDGSGEALSPQVTELRLPPLRERREEIAPLASFFLDRLNAEFAGRFALIPPIMAGLIGEAWPGNVGELERAVRTLVLTGRLPSRS